MTLSVIVITIMVISRIKVIFHEPLNPKSYTPKLMSPSSKLPP